MRRVLSITSRFHWKKKNFQSSKNRFSKYPCPSIYIYKFKIKDIKFFEFHPSKTSILSNSRLLRTCTNRTRTSCCFSSRQDREETGGGERKLRRSRRRKTGRDRQTKHRRRAREVGLCARWGSDLNLGLETSPWAVRRPSIGPSTQALPLLFPPKNIPVVIVVVVVVILERIAHAAHDVRRERERGGYHCECIMQRDRRCIPRDCLRERRRRTCIDRIPRTVETVLRKKNITALKYKGDPR